MGPADRITELRVRGMKACRDVTLRVDGLTVLIGDNGTGKSTLVEALELLSRAAVDADWLRSTFIRRHGGLEAMLRQGERELSLGVTIEHPVLPKLEYDLSVGFSGSRTEIVGETLDAWTGEPEPLRAILRTPDRTRVFDYAKKTLVGLDLSNELVLTHFGEAAPPAIARVKSALGGIDVHVPFAVSPRWLVSDDEGMRAARVPEPTEALERFGNNLALCYHTLRNDHSDRWPAILERARLGLGQELADILTPIVGRGIELALKWRGMRKPVAAHGISDGQLSWLAFLALVELGVGDLVAFDEPECHLHPMLLTRVAWLLEQRAKQSPVIVTTHSDRFLDALEDPARSVVLCELDSQRATTLVRPNPTALEGWLARYRGIGEIRSEGYEAQVFAVGGTNAE